LSGASRPSLLRERFCNTNKLIVIDEIQKAPALLDEKEEIAQEASGSRKYPGSMIFKTSGKLLKDRPVVAINNMSVNKYCMQIFYTFLEKRHLNVEGGAFNQRL